MKTFIPHTAVQQSQAISCEVFRSVAAIDEDLLSRLVEKDHLFFSKSYLQALEQSVNSDIQFRYAVIKKDNAPVGIAFFQLIEFKGSNIEASPCDTSNIAGHLKYVLKNAAALAVKPFSARLLVNGSVGVTGPYGFCFENDKVDKAECSQLLWQAVQAVVKKEKGRVSGILLKDFAAGEAPEALENKGFLRFKVEPDMLLKIDPEWKSAEDYLAAMKSHYRVRARKALKLAEALTIREMDAKEVENALPVMSDLYDQILDASDFKLTKINPAYFAELKRSSPEKFRVVGFFEGKKLVSFISYYLHKNRLVAGLMGMEREKRDTYDLYLNVLYQLVEEGIRHGVQCVEYGRTAMEIKSSVGAQPKELELLVKHNNPLFNIAIRPLIRILTKEKGWHQRHPFRQ